MTGNVVSRIYGACFSIALAVGIAGSAQAQTETITFEGFAEGAIVDMVMGDGGSGPIGVEGVNPALGGNTAVIFDSDCPGGCAGEDDDLGTPNETFGGPGEGSGGEMGMPFENDTAQNNVLIVTEDLTDVLPGPPDGLVDDPDDADEDNAMLKFDFSALGEVTIESITLIDVEGDEAPAQVTFFDTLDMQIGLPFDLPAVGDNGLAIVDLGSVPGVVRMEVLLRGSGAIDDIVFTREAGTEGCTPGYWKQEHHFDSWPAAFMPSDLFSDTFEDAYPGMTLLDVLENNGNQTGLEALGRHTVAALLNAASADVDYDLTEGEVIDAFNDVFPGSKGDYNDVKDDLAELNELGCPLN
ncbi:MAG: hypothetical protein R3245_02045 [Kiloniellales bacterium]|nr:hypothetical protein [Kiloniellales bacterium]